MRRLALSLFVLTSVSAAAQKEELFGSGKPVVYREEMLDRRFTKSLIFKLLQGLPGSGIEDPACVQLAAGLFTVLAEIGPTLHKRDENFFLDPALIRAVDTQLSTPRFTAMTYVQMMVRRVMIDHRLSDEWLETAKRINKQAKVIDLAKLKQLNDGVQLVDSAYFQLPTLKNRYITEVVAAHGAVTTNVARDFHDDYVNRDVAWGSLVLIDAGLNVKKGKKPKAAELAQVVAILEYHPPIDPRKAMEVDYLPIPKEKKEPPLKVYAKLLPKQFADIEKLPRLSRVMVKGRFWEMNQSLTEVEVTEALLFEDRPWSNGVVLGDPNVIATCAAALNDLTGLAPQPGGFKN